MLLRGISALEDAARDGIAVAGFVAYNLETAQGIVAAGERTGLPILLQAGSSAFHHAGRRELAMICLELARASDAAVGVHLDHSRSLEEIEECIELGYTSVMFDGSHLLYEENVELTRDVVARAHAAGVWVEAELVGTAGDEDVSTGAQAGAMTDPDRAREFVAATGIDALAVAVGNVHGFTPTEPRIDLERLAAIRSATVVPLVLHGASGLSETTLRACLERGISKINVNTELRRAYLEAFAAALPDARAAVDLVTPLAAAREAIASAAAETIRSLAGATARSEE
jgi:tagatose 1,6-diphosphate aldolase GatY/KbaY